MDQSVKIACTEGKVGGWFCQLSPLNENTGFIRVCIITIYFLYFSTIILILSPSDVSFTCPKHMFDKKKPDNNHFLGLYI